LFPLDTTIPPVSPLFPLDTKNRGVGGSNLSINTQSQFGAHAQKSSLGHPPIGRLALPGKEAGTPILHRNSQSGLKCKDEVEWRCGYVDEPPRKAVPTRNARGARGERNESALNGRRRWFRRGGRI
jgi:hypothetical protein